MTQAVERGAEDRVGETVMVVAVVVISVVATGAKGLMAQEATGVGEVGVGMALAEEVKAREAMAAEEREVEMAAVVAETVLAVMGTEQEEGVKALAEAGMAWVGEVMAWEAKKVVEVEEGTA